jgi:hypothetical protein
MVLPSIFCSAAKSKDGKKTDKLNKGPTVPSNSDPVDPKIGSSSGDEPPVSNAEPRVSNAELAVSSAGPAVSSAPVSAQVSRTRGWVPAPKLVSSPRTSSAFKTRASTPKANTTEATNSIIETVKDLFPSTFNGPRISRNVYAAPVYLKAHGTSYLEDKDPQVFSVLQNVLTPYLEKAVSTGLDAYTLEIKYSPQPSENPPDDPSILVTYMQIDVALEVTTVTVAGLRQTNAVIASEWIRNFFEGQDFYKFLGECRSSGCEITEMVLQGADFRHPAFSGSSTSIAAATGSGQKGGSSSRNKKESKSGLFVALAAGIVAVGAVLAVSLQDKQRRSQLLRTFRLDASGNISDLDSRSHSSSDSEPARPRTFSGTLRRHPPGGIKPAAIQKKPAFTETLKQPTMSGLAPPSTGSPSFRSERSYSIAGDFNIPSEYDLKTSPMVDYSHASPGKKYANDEFSMPEEYSMAEFDSPVSKYPTENSPRQRGYGRDQNNGTLRFSKGKKSKPLSPAFSADSSATRTPPGKVDGYPNRSPRLQMSSTMNDPLHDEWSVDSYSTVSHDKPSVPYRGWSRKPKDLDMPPLK